MFRHRFDPSSLVAAVLFFGIAARYLDHATNGTHIPYAWTVPAVVVSIILLSVTRLVFRGRRREP